MSNKEAPHSLVLETIDLVGNRSVKVSLTSIAEGADVPIAWLSLFSLGKIGQPNAHRVLKVYEYMTGKNIQATLSQN